MTTVRQISVQELKNRLDSQPRLNIIDVRELHEWENMHIPQALHIPMAELPLRIKDIVADYNQPIYIHCQGGVRSHKSAQALLDLGYQEVYSIDGGLSAWANCGYPIES
jgi:rhodanese-related sulfurtransferase